MVFLTVPLAFAMGASFTGASSSLEESSLEELPSLEESSLEELLSLEESPGDALLGCIIDERRFRRGNNSQPFDSLPGRVFFGGKLAWKERT